MKRLLAVLFAALPAAGALAQEPAVTVERGTAGLAVVPFAVSNRTDRPIACQAALAHWYSVEVGRTGVGGSVRAALWSDPGTGTVFLLNAAQDRMPVQALWCGVEGEPFATRFPIALQRRAGVAEPAIRLECTGVGQAGVGEARLRCQRNG